MAEGRIDSRRRNEPTPGRRRDLPKAVWALGLTSLLMDASSEAIHALLPLFLITTLGAPATIVGLVEGAGEATAAAFKLAGGACSDRLPRRKPVVVLGYGLAALSKPFFAFADSVTAVIFARLVDRTGKGLRGAARDALIADLVEPSRRGAAFGLRQSLDTLGALIGPLAAAGLMLTSGGDIRQVYLIATLPALLAVLVLVRFVHEPVRGSARPRCRPAHGRRAEHGRASPTSWRHRLAALPPAFRIALGGGVLLMLARIGESFLILTADDREMAAAAIPLAYVLMNGVHAATAWPAGRLADRWGAARLLVLGALLLAAADLLLGRTDDRLALALGIAVWGLHMGFSQSLMTTLIARTLPETQRGLGFGVFHAALGLAALVGGVAGGLLWDAGGPALAWSSAAVLALTAALPFLRLARRELS